MDIFNAALGAIMLVIVTMTVRDWIRAIKESREERRKQHQRMKYYKYK
jgi:dsRNA-specific ribonuclease